MADIVERLKKLMVAGPIHGSIAIEAINEIERLRTAGKAALNDIDGGNDASAHLILKHNFGKADG